MVEFDPTTSRRALLSAFAIVPLASFPGSSIEHGRSASSYPRHSGLEMPAHVGRTPEGRSASRFRYHNAEGFFRAIEQGIVRDARDRLYQTGIVLQLGLSSHLFDVGLTDEWCARHIGLDVARSLAYANATGFGFESTEFKLLTAVLSPYGKWRFAEPLERIDDPPFTPDQIRRLTRECLDQVRHVTGHARPRRSSSRHG